MSNKYLTNNLNVNVLSIYKSEPKHNVENYRAVCIESELPKLLDCLVTRLLTWECKNILIDEQHGFIQGRSINTNLLIYENFIINTFESRLQVDSVYTDFSKAFDRVNHSLLLPKLKALGIDGKVLMWIQSFLSSRTQSVKYRWLSLKNVAGSIWGSSGISLWSSIV